MAVVGHIVDMKKLNMEDIFNIAVCSRNLVWIQYDSKLMMMINNYQHCILCQTAYVMYACIFRKLSC